MNATLGYYRLNILFKAKNSYFCAEICSQFTFFCDKMHLLTRRRSTVLVMIEIGAVMLNKIKVVFENFLEVLGDHLRSSEITKEIKPIPVRIVDKRSSYAKKL